MMKLKHYSWLMAIAAALVMTTASCSSENDLVETPNIDQPTQPTIDGVKITVRAGISDGDASTRSEVVLGTNAQGKTTRTLKFTEGDRLYVCGKIIQESTTHKTVAGYLDIDATTISADGTSADFSGTVKAYKYTSSNPTPEEIDYTFTKADPLQDCTTEAATAWLIHRDTEKSTFALGDLYTIAVGKNAIWNTVGSANLEDLMTQRLPVTGTYDGSGFPLSCECPIFNCVFTNLAPGKSYTVILEKTPSSGYRPGQGTITADSKGYGSCAFAAQQSVGVEANWYLQVNGNNNQGSSQNSVDLALKRLQNVRNIL